MMKTASTLALMLLAGACTTDNVVASPVPAFRETVGMGMTGDAADDPAIWVNPNDPAKSLILGTNKDEAEAKEWYKRAAQLNFTPAINALGVMKILLP